MIFTSHEDLQVMRVFYQSCDNPFKNKKNTKSIREINKYKIHTTFLEVIRNSQEILFFRKTQILKIIFVNQWLTKKKLMDTQPSQLLNQKTLSIKSNDSNQVPAYYLIKIKRMSTTHFESTLDLEMLQPLDLRPKMRTYQIKIKQKRSELDDYELRQTIGQGGFGKVKKAVHRMTGELVAVKVCCLDQYDQQNLNAIEREIQIQKNLLHENIAQIYQVIKKDSKIYIFMEYCKNGELFDKINRNGPLAQRDAAKIFNQLVSALLYLKENNLSHRDIKPQNILFDQNWNLKLIDFGFSCSAQPGEFRKTVCGTPSYTPPQIIKKTSYDAELADVWSLGVTLYAMLAAQLPFEGQTNEKRKANILGYRYGSQPSFSNKAQKLISSIFVDAKYRPKLIDLKNSQFSLAYEPNRPHFIDFRSEDLVIEDDIIEVIDKDYHVDPQKVVDSVKNHRFDKYHALYYLTIKNEKHTHKHIQNDDHLDEFKKRRKGSLIKLEPIASRTPSISKRNNSFKILKMDKKSELKFTPKHMVDPNSSRLRKNDPDSPRRLIDCLAAYKAY